MPALMSLLPTSFSCVILCNHVYITTFWKWLFILFVVGGCLTGGGSLFVSFCLKYFNRGL